MLQPLQSASQTEAIKLLAAQIGLPIAPADFKRVEAMIKDLWRSGGRIRSAFDDDMSVIPLPIVPEHPGVSR